MTGYEIEQLNFIGHEIDIYEQKPRGSTILNINIACERPTPRSFITVNVVEFSTISPSLQARYYLIWQSTAVDFEATSWHEI